MVHGVSKSRTWLSDWIELIVDWECCDSFRWKWRELAIHNTCIHSPQNGPPFQAVIQHWVEFRVLYSRALLVIHFKYSSMYMTIPNSLTVSSLSATICSVLKSVTPLTFFFSNIFGGVSPLISLQILSVFTKKQKTKNKPTVILIVFTLYLYRSTWEELYISSSWSSYLQMWYTSLFI